MVSDQGKEAGGPWECYDARNFFGWEADRVVAVTYGAKIMEMITRAKTMLAVIIVDGHGYSHSHSYAKSKEYFQEAADQGLIEDYSES